MGKMAVPGARLDSGNEALGEAICGGKIFRAGAVDKVEFGPNSASGGFL